ncbi:MAG: hypothetical protein R2862_11680 [Thermoanaerobaculia bacterium]
MRRRRSSPTDSAGGFSFPLSVKGLALIETEPYDEIRFVFSVWHPSDQKVIDLDRAYLELQGSFGPDEALDKLAEIRRWSHRTAPARRSTAGSCCR